MSNLLALHLSRRDDLNEEELRAIEALTLNKQDVKAGATMMRQGDRPKHSILILEGFAARAHYLADGKRMLSALHIAGDFVDLHSFLVDEMDHDVIALTDCRIALAAHSDLRRITERLPHLTRLLWLSTLTDSATYRAWIVALGRKSPISHMAHILCEMVSRLEVMGLASGKNFRLPITQTDLADVLGLSVVHVNRTLQDLRATDLVSWIGQNVSIKDWDGLCALAQFNPAYLNLNKMPR